MRNILSKIVSCAAAFMLLPTIQTAAQSDLDLGSRLSIGAQEEDDDELLIEIKTSLYDEDGASNSFTLALGSTTPGIIVTIDCGYGRKEFEVTVAELDEDSNITGANYTGKVSREGVVRIYGDPSEIDYLNASGCSVYEINFHPDLNLKLLNLEHNNLQRIDLDKMENLQVLYIMDNPFDKEPFNISARLENLAVLEIGELGNIAPDFSLSQFPQLMSFDAYHTLGLKSVDPSACPGLFRLSAEMTSIDKVDVTQNPSLMVLNVSETRVKELDLSHNPELAELYCMHGSGTINTDVKFTTLDLSHNPKLEYLFCGGNNITSLDVSQNEKLVILSAPNNLLESINLDNNTNLYTVNLDGNKMNFATLPEPKQTWGEYYYDERDLEIDDTYKEGDELDFSSQVLREGTETKCVLYYSPKDDPIKLTALPNDYYNYDNGKVTLLKAYNEQLRLVFSNSLLSDYDLYSQPFRVTTAENFGKDVKALSISSISAEGAEVKMAIGIVGASTQEPVTIQVDLGNGETQPFVVTSENPSDFNVTAKRTGNAGIDVYVPQDRYISALKTEDLTIGNIDLSNLTELRVLSIVNADLYSIDLKYNAKLEELTITGNPYLTKIDLSAKTQYYYKGKMANVNLSHNGLTSLVSDDLYMMHYLDLSHNQFAEFDVTDADYLVEIDLSDNQIDVLQFNNSSELKKANLSNNRLYYLYITDEAPLEYLDISGNVFAYGSMPENPWNLDDSQYVYAPQQPINIATTSPGIDLSAYYYRVENAVTQYLWKNTEGKTLTEGTDYTMKKGVTKFLEPVIGQTLYCELTHAAYPQFEGENVLRTTDVTVIDNPTIELARFTTTTNFELATVVLSSTKPNTSVYFDWEGNGDLTQYVLSADQVLEAQAYTSSNVEVRVYADNVGDNFRVFSISDASMSSFDGSKLTEAVLIGVENAGLSSLTLPASDNLKELKLSGNKLTELDLTPYPNLYYLGANNNLFERFDFGQAPKLALAFLAYNQLSEVSFDNNVNLWNLDLGCNQFSEISLEGAPNMEQLWLNGNRFDHLDLSYLKHLLVLDLVDNFFTFATLEHFTDMSFNVFHYGNQADVSVTPVGNQVDLSSQAMICNEQTEYRWFRGKPTYNDDAELEGDELTLGEDFTVSDGITTFLSDEEQNDLVCMMTNAALPNLELFTLPIKVTPTSIEQLHDSNAPDCTSKELHDGQIIIKRGDTEYNLFGIMK